MTTSFDPQLKLTEIHKHPHNPRRRAIADPDMVASIVTNGILEPIIVAPLEAEGYVLIAGHRRVDGAKKAKRKTAPALVREDLDTEAKQLEAMLIENGHRQDLTPIEEAEGYEQLGLFGYSQKKIAATTGRDVKTVRSRLQLLKLGKATQTKVHKGQITLDVAQALVEFADDAAAVKDLEKAAGDPYSWKWTIARARENRKHDKEAQTTAAKLRDAGVPEHTTPGKYTYNVWDDVDGAVHIYRTSAGEPEDHDGCLIFAIADHQVWYGCTDPTKHAGQISESEQKRRDEVETHRQQQEQRRADEDLASKLRVDALLEQVGIHTSLPPVVRNLVRDLLPQAIDAVEDKTSVEAYQTALNVPEDRRWSPYRTKGDDQLVDEHLADVDQWSDGILTRALIALLGAFAEGNLRAPSAYSRRDGLALRYLDALETSYDHDPGPIDQELRAELTEDEDQEATA